MTYLVTLPMSETMCLAFFTYSVSSIPVVSAATSARPFVGEVLVFLLFKGKLIKHANHRMRQEAVCSYLYIYFFIPLGIFHLVSRQYGEPGCKPQCHKTEADPKHPPLIHSMRTTCNLQPVHLNAFSHGDPGINSSR
jgi:hypothetical protein